VVARGAPQRALVLPDLGVLLALHLLGARRRAVVALLPPVNFVSREFESNSSDL
jgi:hypothetical protein